MVDPLAAPVVEERPCTLYPRGTAYADCMPARGRQCAIGEKGRHDMAAQRTPAVQAVAKAATKASAKKTSPKKTAAKQTATKKTATKKTATKKTATKKTATKETVTRKTPAKKAAAEMPAATERKGAASSSAANPTTVKKTTAKPAPAKKTSAKKASAKQGSAKPAPAAPKSVVALAVRDDERPWTASEIAEVRATLESDQQRLEEEISAAEEEIGHLLREGGEGAGHDQADVGSNTFERDHEMSMAKNARDNLTLVKEAIARVDEGTYGVCESCGQPIGKMRLQAFPRATLCMECKQRQERR
jgi:RNA polymerase-binding protein DksA